MSDRGLLIGDAWPQAADGRAVTVTDPATGAVVGRSARL